MADDVVPTNMALMAFSELRMEFNKSEFNLAIYKRGLASVEKQLVFYKKNEVIFCEQNVVLKRDISYKDSEIHMLKRELEKTKQEKEIIQLKIENFDNASKILDKLIGSQITDNSRKGLEEFQQHEFEGYGSKTSKNVSEGTSNEVRESPDTPLVEKLVSKDKLEKKTVSPTTIEFVRPKQQEKPVRKPIKYAEMYRKWHQREPQGQPEVPPLPTPNADTHQQLIGYNSNGSGPRPAQAARECSYSEFLKCKPLDFKGTEGVVGLTRWFEKMEYVFSISNCTAASQVKFATCTLQDDALTWWNAHVKTTTLKQAQAMPWGSTERK
ncbi:hypothetical protein Tco_0572575 [Tanacetum coccineum]